VDTFGEATLCFNKTFTELQFKVIVCSGKKITQAHLHFGRANVNGPIVAFLFNVAPLAGPGGVNVNGTLAKGTLTNSDIVCNTDEVVNITSLYDQLRRGNIYVNVHSEQFPGGVVRGQVFPPTTTG
jgi:hypothetical protein